MTLLVLEQRSLSWKTVLELGLHVRNKVGLESLTENSLSATDNSLVSCGAASNFPSIQKRQLKFV